MLALLLLFSVLFVRQAALPDGPYRGDDLPGFDAYVYVAMAEHPRFFTVVPWGYRVLTPWLVRGLPVRAPRGFRLVTLAALAAAGLALFLFLRRLGFNEPAGLLGVAAFGLSGPVGELLKNPFLTDPLALALEMVFLLALESAAGPALLALLALMGALAKEFFLLLLPLLYLARRPRLPDRSALRFAALAALPALAVTLLLRMWWQPHLPTLPAGAGSGSSFDVLDNLARFGQGPLSAALLGGLTPLALLGLLRKKARPFLRRYGYLLLATALPPFFNPVVFSPGDVPRLLVYTLAGVIPAALFALDRAWPVFSPPAAPVAGGRWLNRLAAIALAASVALPVLALDRYRRLDLSERRYGPMALVFCRESLRAARRLERGSSVSLEPSSDPSGAGDWFLREGWRPIPPTPAGTATMAGGEAFLVLPTLRPAARTLALSLSAEGEGQLAVAVNEAPVGEAWLTGQAREHAFEVPAAALFRGDNLLTLRWQGPPGLKLHRLTISPQSHKQRGAGFTPAPSDVGGSGGAWRTLPPDIENERAGFTPAPSGMGGSAKRAGGCLVPVPPRVS